MTLVYNGSEGPISLSVSLVLVIWTEVMGFGFLFPPAVFVEPGDEDKHTSDKMKTNIAVRRPLYIRKTHTHTHTFPNPKPYTVKSLNIHLTSHTVSRANQAANSLNVLLVDFQTEIAFAK